jgi:hypothetical protein
MFLVLTHKKDKNPLGEGSSKDGGAPSFTDMSEMPNEQRALLQEQFWGGVNKTNFVSFLDLKKYKYEHFLKIYLKNLKFFLHQHNYLFRPIDPNTTTTKK